MGKRIEGLRRMRPSRKGFSLIELIAVVAIIGALVAMLAPVVTKQIKKGKLGRLEADTGAIEKAVIIFYVDNASYPAYSYIGNCVETGNEISDLLQQNDNGTGWDGPYLDKSLTRFGSSQYGVGCTSDILGCSGTLDWGALSVYAQLVVIADFPTELSVSFDNALDDGSVTSGRVQFYGTNSTCVAIGTSVM